MVRPQSFTVAPLRDYAIPLTIPPARRTDAETMDLLEFVIIARAPIPEVDALAGDSILVRPGHPDPIVVVHRPPHAAYGELAAAIAEGHADSPTLSSSAALQRLVALARSSAPRPARVLAFPQRGDRLA